MHLTTARLVLRSMTPADVTPQVAGWYADPEVTRHLYQHAHTRAMSPADLALAFVKSADNKHRFLIGMFVKETGEPIGYVRFTVDHRNRQVCPTTVIGDKRYWVKRIPTELYAALTPFFFDVLGMHKIVMYAYAENRATIRLLTFGGYEREGYFREHDWDGERLRDVVQFGRLAADWRKSGKPY